MQSKRWILGGLSLVVVSTAAWLGVRRLPDTAQAIAPAPTLRPVAFLPERNRVNLAAPKLPDSWDVKKGTNILWSADVGTKAYGGPVVAGDKIFVGTNNDNPRNPAIQGDKGVLMCFEKGTGKFLWQIVHDKLPQGHVNDWPLDGVGSSPVIDGGRLYYVSNRCEVICADVNGDPKSPGLGKTIWSFDMIDKLGVFPHNRATCSPLIVDDTVFVVTANGVHKDHITIPAPEAPSFLALDKITGKERWSSRLPTQALVDAKRAGGPVNVRQLVNAGKLLMHGQWSNPVFAPVKDRPQVIFPGGDGWLYSFKPDSGELLWKFDCNPKGAVFVLAPRGTRNDFIATPVVWENKLYIGVGQDPEHKEGVGHLWCIDVTKDPKNADKDLSPTARNVRLLGFNLPLMVLDPKGPANKDSALVWHRGGMAHADGNRDFLFGRTLSTCAVHDGLLYTADLSGYVYCFDAISGQEYWVHDTKASILGSPYWVDGKVYIATEDGVMLVFKHGKQKTDPVEIEMGGRASLMPTAANGVLYCLTESKSKLLAIGWKK